MAPFSNPLIADGADPWIVVHEGRYHLLYSGHDHVPMRIADTLEGLRDAEPLVLWRGDHPNRSQGIWAPELHRIDGRWIIYTCGTDDHDITHRLVALESDTGRIEGPYRYRSTLVTDADDRYYAIDGHVADLGSHGLHLFWAGHPDHRIFVSRMDGPFATQGERIMLEADGFGLEEVREGPVTLVGHGRVFLFYSMGDTGKPDYRLGALWMEEGADPMDPANWRQHPSPLLTRNDAAGVYGPGHNGFFKDERGDDWIVYHAKARSEYTYEGRNPRVGRVRWSADGWPEIEPPAPEGPYPGEL